MGQKHYPKSLRDEAVLFYERGHTFAETKAKYGMSQSTFYEWKKQFDQAHPVPETSETDLSAARKAQRHLEKLSLELEVLRQCPCGTNASIDEKMTAIEALGNKYSVHVLCDALGLPRGTYYNRKRREGMQTSYELNDEAIKPLIEKSSSTASGVSAESLSIISYLKWVIVSAKSELPV